MRNKTTIKILYFVKKGESFKKNFKDFLIFSTYKSYQLYEFLNGLKLYL